MNNIKFVLFLAFLVLSGCDLDGDGVIYNFNVDSNIHYADEELRERFKNELENEGIPFKTYHADGEKEFISWDDKFDSQVKELQVKIVGLTPPEGRSVSYQPQSHNERLKQKLQRVSIPFTLTQYYGDEYIIWPSEYKEKVEKIINREYPNDLFGEAQLFIDIGETDKGFKLLQDASNAGNPKAQVALGVELTTGEYLERDDEKAALLYKQAADQNDIDGFLNLGLAYYYGRGVEQDDAMALDWLQQAANDGDMLGMWLVGKFYKEGRGGLEENSQKSEEWYNKAKALGADFSFLDD